MNNCEALNFVARCLSPEPELDSGKDLDAQVLSGGVEWTRIVSLASAHYVVPSLYPELQRKGLVDPLPSDLRDYLETIWALNRERNERLRHQLTELARDLNAVGVVPLVLKGANVLLPNPWPGAFDRVLGDLDIHVPEALLMQAVSAMNKRGYRAAPEKFSGSDALTTYHFRPLIHPDHPARVELHTELGIGVLTRLLPRDQVRHEAESRTLGDTRVLQPAAFWRLLHVLLNTGVQDHHHRRRSLELRQLNDWVQLRRLYERRIAWPAMQQRLVESGQAALLPSYLLLAQTLFGQSLPEGIHFDVQARRTASETLEAMDGKWMARRFRAGAWFYRLPRRLRSLPRKLITPSWYAYHLGRCCSGT